ncbi:acyltransferase [Steroidobacter agaridevorans]|uniref:Acyltransferase n=1 Tax=Steroidobacter agaridevorans TaxID=2695856 RepID=A0A829YFG2_9GAMM|nr:acyltransferase [Steroidobacter agaridevorans]GFE82155.1 acyltransferase [Steroidobacter agaridevorans]
MLRWLSVTGAESRLTAMEGLRAYAAGIVFLFHSALLMQEQQHAAGPVIDWMLHSQYGVDIFFILSGYLIAGIASKPGFRLGAYLSHRALRIYPAFLGTLLMCLIGLAVLRGEHVSFERLVGNLFFLNGAFGLGVQAINGVTWSLFFEFSFYIAFPLLYRHFGLARTMVICAVLIAMLGHLDTRFVRFMFFFAGVWLRLRDSSQPWASERFAIAFYLLVTTGTIYLQKYLVFAALYVPAATLIVDHALHTKGMLQRVFSRPALRVLGNVSYSFYLVQPIGLLAARYAIEPLGLAGVSWCIALLVVGFAITFVLSSLSFVALERPYFTYRHLLVPGDSKQRSRQDTPVAAPGADAKEQV